MFTPNETHELLKLHEKLDTLTKALHNLNLKAEVFVVAFSLHEVQVDEIKSEILNTLDKINQVWDKWGFLTRGGKDVCIIWILNELVYLSAK